jgi:hypothetical protein
MPVMAVAEPIRAEQESIVTMPVENVVEPMEIVREDAGRVDDGTAV